MAENREYISRPDELGNIHISSEVLAALVAAAALEVEGVGSLTANLGSDLAELLGKKNLSKGVQILVEGDSVHANLSILVKYGYVIPDVAKAVQDAVYTAVENTSGLAVESVDVTVSGILFDHPHEAKKN